MILKAWCFILKSDVRPTDCLSRSENCHLITDKEVILLTREANDFVGRIIAIISNYVCLLCHPYRFPGEHNCISEWPSWYLLSACDCNNRCGGSSTQLTAVKLAIVQSAQEPSGRPHPLEFHSGTSTIYNKAKIDEIHTADGWPGRGIHPPKHHSAI